MSGSAHALGHALRHAWRALRARPALTLTVVLTLALGVGANAAMLGALDALLLRAPPHVTDAGRLVRVHARFRFPHDPNALNTVQSYPLYAALRDRAPAFERVAAVWSTTLALGTGAAAERVAVQAVTPEFFALAGVRPALGRALAPADDASAEPGVVLSHAHWQRHHGGAPDVLGRAITLAGRPFRVVGVAPPGFTGLDWASVDVWAPMTAVAPVAMGRDVLTSVGWSWLEIVGRLRAGPGSGALEAARVQATAQVTTELRRVDEGAARFAPRAVLSPLPRGRQPDADDRTARHLGWLALMSGALVLAAVATAGGLLLTRALERQRELAVRRALGASAGRLLGGVAAEGALLAALSAVGAMGAAWAMGTAVRTYLLPARSFGALPALDGRVLAATVVLAALAVAGGALVSLRAGLGAEGQPALVAAGRAVAGGRARALGLVVGTQVALTFVLLLAAGLFARSLERALATRIGWDAPRTLVADLAFPDDAGWTEARRAAAWRRARERVAAVPGVAAAALSGVAPLRTANGVAVHVPGIAELPTLPGGGPYVGFVTPEFFDAAALRALDGALPRAARGGPVVVVDSLMARTLWPRGDAVGRCLALGDATSPCRPIVAVVEPARRFQLVEDRAMQYYWVTDTLANPSALVVRTTGDAAALVPAVRRAMAEANPSLPPARPETLAQIFAPNYAPWRAGTVLLGAFAAIATLLSGVGIFGTVSYAAAQRTREVGVRVALGASAGHVVRLLVRGGLGPALAGLAVGALAFAAVQRVLGALLYGVGTRDPLAVGAAALVVAAAAALAAYLPARRASRVAPATVLRAE